MLEIVSQIRKTHLLDEQLFCWRHFSKTEVVQNTDLNILALCVLKATFFKSIDLVKGNDLARVFQFLVVNVQVINQIGWGIFICFMQIMTFFANSYIFL